MKRIVIIFLLINLIFISCSKKQNQAIVVRIGSNQSVSLKEFRLAYLEILKQPQVYDSKKLRQKFLNELINRKLFARLAREQGLDKDEKIQGLVDAYRGKCLREAHYKAVIEPKVKINETELKAVYAYMRQQRKLKHLFFKTKAQADEAYRQLKAGASWDDLANKIFKGTSLAHTGGELGWVNWDQLDYPLAMAAFQQPRGTFTKTVKSTYGYHLIFVQDLKLDPLVTEEEFKIHRQKTLKLLKAKKGQSIAAKYIENMMRPIRIQVHPKVMQIIGKKLGAVLHRQPSTFDRMRTFQLNDEEVHRLERSLWNLRQEVLATIDGKPLTVQKFIFALNFVPYAQVRKSFKTALNFVLRDQVLTREAEKMHLERQYDFVRLKPQIYEDYLLQLKMHRRLIRNVTVSDEEIDRYLSKHHRKFKNMVSDSLRIYLKKELLNDKRRSIIENTLDSLKTQIPIEKNLEPINAFYDRLEDGGENQ